MGVIAGIADNVAVMREGEIVETGSVDDVFYRCRARLYAHAARLRSRASTDPQPLAIEPADEDIAQGRRSPRLLPRDDARLSLRQDEAVARRRRRELHARARARPWASWANRAAENPRWRAPSCKLAAPTQRRRRLATAAISAELSEAEVRAAAQGIPDRLPGPAGQPRSAHDDRPVDRRAAQVAAPGHVARRGDAGRAQR